MPARGSIPQGVGVEPGMGWDGRWGGTGFQRRAWLRLPPSQSGFMAGSVLQADIIRGLEIYGATEAGLKDLEIGELGMSPRPFRGALPLSAALSP